MARFVLLYHDCPAGYERPSHWDLMLEADGVLRTWAVARLPRGWSATRLATAELFPECAMVADDDSVGAEQLADHRIDYLQLEGGLSGNRGHVRRIDRGSYEADCRGRAGGELELMLSGELLRGKAVLRPETVQPPVRGAPARWTLTSLDS